MNVSPLQKHIGGYKAHLEEDREKHAQDLAEKQQCTEYYQSFAVRCATFVDIVEATR